MEGFWGIVTAIVEDTPSIQILNVLVKNDLEVKAIHYIYQTNKCEVGSEVMVNLSAIDLNLGTGGYGFVMAIQKEKQPHGLPAKHPGHIMKLRYSPVQTPVLAVESVESDHHSAFCSPFSLDGKKVLIGELHSMLPIMISLLYTWQEGRNIVYIMDDQASLYISLSEHVRYLKEKINLTTITFGQALGGDLEAVNLYTALEAAVKVLQADDIIVTHGPGVVGTATQRGFSGIQLVQWLHTIHTCGGEGIVIPRIQFGDQRQRHFGLSHHLLGPFLNHALIPAHIPYPVTTSADKLASTGERNDNHILTYDKALEHQFALLTDKHYVKPIPIDRFKSEIERALAWYERPIKTMGRDYEDEPYFYYGVGAAFQLYKEMI